MAINQAVISEHLCCQEIHTHKNITLSGTQDLVSSDGVRRYYCKGVLSTVSNKLIFGLYCYENFQPYNFPCAIVLNHIPRNTE